MAHLSSQDITLEQLLPVFVAADPLGDTFEAGDRTFLHLRNHDVAASVTAVVNDPNSVRPAGATDFDPDVTIVVEPESERLVGPFSGSRFADPTDGFVHVSYDTTSDVEVAVIRGTTPGQQ